MRFPKPERAHATQFGQRAFVLLARVGCTSRRRELAQLRPDLGAGAGSRRALAAPSLRQ
jgi:hypothetical protein